MRVCEREREKENRDFHTEKKVEDVEIVCLFFFFFYPIVYIYLLNVFWGFGSCTVVDGPYNTNIISLHWVWAPPGRASIGTCLECLCVNPALLMTPESSQEKLEM